ncbi:helix-turn-helix domain-containing protein [Azospirillum halopraeferens]|uniref:helix-turn-helix domain-containing protein n=1 Tax=Azospirillum halopraeferens TaxID=34010 RepID=UPI00040ADCF6|nr:helix-turn-helix domain-containing protein [Azospirillum halopraeferens]
MAAHLATLDHAATVRPAFAPVPGHRSVRSGGGTVVAFPDLRGADTLEAIADTVVAERETMLFSEGDAAGDLYRVIDGMVRIYKLLPDGRRQIVGFLQAGDMMGLTLGPCYLYTAETVTTCSLQRLPRSRFEALMEAQPALARSLHARTATELVAAQDHMLLLGRKTAVEKVASFLLLLATRSRSASSLGGRRVRLPMSRNDIADYLGLTTETVSRAFTKLKTGGLIRLLEGGLVEIVDRDGLAGTTEGA